MSNTAKVEQYEAELRVFALRSEAGVQAIRDWAYSRRDEINARWLNTSGDELLQYQGEARFIARLIKLIDKGPAIKGDA